MGLGDVVGGLVAWSATFLTPDWGQLVLAIPLALLALVGLFLTWTAYRWAYAGPTRRGFQRRHRQPPPGVHLPGPSFAPVLAAIGVFFLAAGIVAGGPWLLVGASILAVTLLVWGRESVREYDVLGGHNRIGGQAAAGNLAPSRHTGSAPPGVHLPAPSFRPVLVAFAAAILVAALVVGGPGMLVIGGLAIAITLLGWLADARREYRSTELADTTGHPEPAARPAWPVGTIAVLLWLLVAGLLLAATGLGDTSAGAGGGSASPPSSVPPAPGPSAASPTVVLYDGAAPAAGSRFTVGPIHDPMSGTATTG